MVQVIKDPIGTEGRAGCRPRFRSPAHAGLSAPDSHIGISQRIENEAERALLRDRVQTLIPKEEAEKGGFIVRTMAEDATDAELAADIAYLRKLWQRIRAESTTRGAPALLYQDLSLGQRVLARHRERRTRRPCRSIRARTTAC